uniref:ComEA family DNA-binding protein n=1 Tax=Couchioplanes caeruleus TaxID=56438 RepID=UPI001FD102B4|nr:ComEA family DNA-binding protein [Couchioplanes caeruleus]
MREENNPEDPVRARLRTVLAAASAWPDDVTLATAVSGPPVPAPPALEVDLACRPPWSGESAGTESAGTESAGTESALGGAGAFGSDASGLRLGLFDPGRRGVRALTAVAVVVVVIAAVLAWRARPRVEPAAAPIAADSIMDDPRAAGAAVAASSGPAEVVVAVGGKVRRPGLVQLAPGARVADALRAAGGAQPGVDVAPLNLARKVVDGELIMVGVPQPPGAPAAGGGASAAAGGLVNLNTATLADLDTLPGVGPVLAQRILDARDAQGGFRAVGDLRKVDGIGTARYEQLKDLVTV